MTFETNKECMWLKINDKSLKKICSSFLRLRPRLLVYGIKVWEWDWDFSLWSQILRLRLRLLTLVLRIEADNETLKRWSQGMRPRLRPPKSQSQDQSLAQLKSPGHNIVKLISGHGRLVQTRLYKYIASNIAIVWVIKVELYIVHLLLFHEKEFKKMHTKVWPVTKFLTLS